MNQYIITVFKSLPNKASYPPFTEDIHTILDVIKQECFKPEIDEIRTLYASGDPSYVAVKLSLPVFICSGEFSSFGMSGLIKTNNLIVLDFDDIPAPEMQNVWNSLLLDKYVYAMFTSPKGHGYKVIVKLENNTDSNTHRAYFNSLKAHFNSPYFDDCCKDISRACFFSSDPNLYLNENSLVWTIMAPTVQASIPFPKLFSKGPISNTDEEIMRFLEGGWNKRFPMRPGSRNKNVFCRSREAAEWAVDEDYAQSFFKKYIEEDFPEDEITRAVADAYRKTRKNGTFGGSRRNI